MTSSKHVRCIRCEKTANYDTPEGIAIDVYNFCFDCLIITKKDFSPMLIHQYLNLYKSREEKYG